MVALMKTSARNRFTGSVSGIAVGTVNDEVEVTLPDGRTIAAMVTRNSAERLGLAIGSEVVALTKAPWVILATDTEGYRFSARNQFVGTVSRLDRGSVNSAVDVTSGDVVITAVITNESVDEMGLEVGAASTAMFKASNVILAIPS